MCGADEIGPEGQVHVRTERMQMFEAVDSEEEKARLEEITRKFVKKAIQGRPCAFIDQMSKQKRSAQYCLNKTISHLLVFDLEDMAQLLKCPLANILDLQSVEKQEDLFPSGLDKVLTPSEKSDLVIGAYSTETGLKDAAQQEKFYLLLDESAEFLQAIVVLACYARKGGTAALSGAGSDSTDTSLEDVVMKERVMKFCRRAAAGMRYNYIDEKKKAKVSGDFKLDKGMKYLSVMKEGETKETLKCPLRLMVAWYTYADDFQKNAELFPPSVMLLLSPQEKQQTILMEYIPEGKNATDEKRRSPCRFYMVVDDAATFVDVMRVLVIYAQNANKQGR